MVIDIAQFHIRLLLQLLCHCCPLNANVNMLMIQLTQEIVVYFSYPAAQTFELFYYTSVNSFLSQPHHYVCKEHIRLLSFFKTSLAVIMMANVILFFLCHLLVSSIDNGIVILMGSSIISKDCLLCLCLMSFFG